MKGPGGPDRTVEPFPVGRNICEQRSRPVDGDHDQAVEREKIRGKCDPGIRLVREDVAAGFCDLELVHPAAHDPHPECVGELMPEDINPERARQAKKCNKPKQRSERKKPELLGEPERIVDRGAGERREERLS